MIAKVIVDVPVKGTNRPFDYRVPERFSSWIAIGSRVGVPFGPRTVQGFVVGLEKPAEKLELGSWEELLVPAAAAVAPVKLKDIATVLDVEPPLTEELVSLARWMGETYLCHEITALQAMIPGALKAKAERMIALGPHAPGLDGAESPAGASPAGSAVPRLNLLTAEEEAVLRYVGAKGSVSADALLDKFPYSGQLLKSWIQAGVLAEDQVMKDRIAVKTALTVFPVLSPESCQEEAEALPKSAKRQKDVLLYLAEHPEPVRLAELTLALEVGAGTVKSLADKGLLRLEDVEVQRDPYAKRGFARTLPLPLTEEQTKVFEPVKEAVKAGRHEMFLLHGVTGSGKTEVYLQSIQVCLDQGKEAIVLVPEISLTPQMVERFKGRFGDDVAVLHSRLSNGERYDEWRKIASGQVRVVIGARSAIFAPFTKLGLVIIDEEHESSYKQEESPKYHAREVAAARARSFGASVVLGSATPSLESWHEAERGVYKLLTMKERVEGRPMPPVRIVDMRDELQGGNRSMFSRPLHQALQERLERGEQSVLLLNRRGYSTFVMCRSCGYTVICPHCDISLTYHQTSGMLRCHYCGYAERQPAVCPDCQSEHIRYFGTGTQRVEEELAKQFPGIRVIRMDVDTTSEKGAHERLLTDFRQKKADVLLGTQMVAKGLDFPDVTLVGVITADTMLNLPDFRSAERTFQLLTQVAGRAGRHQKPGEVFVQTYTPEHYSVVTAGGHDFHAFVEHELNHRRMGGYPPYCRLILITLSHEQLPFLIKTSENLVKRLKELAQEAGLSGFHPGTSSGPRSALEVLGPVASPIPRIKDRYRFQCMVKYRGDTRVSSIVGRAVEAFDDLCRQEKLLIGVDVDPQVLM
ncbi:primosomal protein N' [Gorillibacterium sp. sgz5001074]|uniref:primosomal protein N' n=1 Tax=Gorillibacterium sp. sgz5001074 TaxID=3446695 RepID=UPI003F67DBAB